MVRAASGEFYYSGKRLSEIQTKLCLAWFIARDTVPHTTAHRYIYLNKHKHRIVNYGYLQAEGISIGSGSVESKIKQIAHRLKITGASWESGNVPQVLRHRSAYLNGCLF